MGANQRERELARQQFVIGEPRPRLALGQDVGGLGRMMQGLQGGRERRETFPLQPGGVLPFGQLWNFRQRGLRGPVADDSEPDRAGAARGREDGCDGP